MSVFRTATVVLAFALLALAGGLYLGGHPKLLPDGLRDAFVDEDQALRAEVVDTIQDNFVRKISDKQLQDASFTGMVRGLDDRFSHYFTPKEAKLFEQSIRGEFSGVGLGVDQDKRGLLVQNVFEDTPAERAGIRKSDVIVAVNGKSIAGEPSEIATAKIKGEPGTEVRLTVLTPSTKRRRRLELERANIRVPVTRGRLREAGGQKLGVAQLATFSDGAHGELRKEIDRLRDRGAKGIVLDLRGNGGGLLQEGILVSSLFIEDGLIVSTKGRTQPRREFKAVGDAVHGKVPLVVLVDRGSASASEIVTGALRDTGRATVVGQRTFGKGVVQQVEDLSNGGRLSLTVSSYFLPKGENISKRGVRPQIRARDNPRTKRDEALPVALDALLERIR